MKLLDKKTASDAPANDEHGEHAAPLGQCNAAIHDVYGQKNLPPDSLVPPIKDGVNYGAPLGKKRAATGFDLTSGYSGSASEKGVVRSLASPALGVPGDQVPDLATLLFAPMARGTEVSVK